MRSLLRSLACGRQVAFEEIKQHLEICPHIRGRHVHRSEIGVLAQTITPQMATGLGLPQDWGVMLSDVDPGGPIPKNSCNRRHPPVI